MSAGQNAPPEDPFDLDFTGHFTRLDVPRAVDPAAPISPETLIGAGDLEKHHYYVNVSHPRPARTIEPARTTVLVLEDDNTTRTILELMLSRDQGYKVRAARDVPEFVIALQKRPLPDLLILDLELPDGVSGFNILSKMRAHPALREMPVIIFTSHSEPAQLNLGLALGADGYLSKPAKAGALAAVVKAVLGAG